MEKQGAYLRDDVAVQDDKGVYDDGTLQMTVTSFYVTLANFQKPYPRMKKSDFYFNLPQELIAQYPLPCRSDSRLLAYNRQTREHAHHQFKDLANLLLPGDLLVMNNSKVIPARFYGVKQSGGRVEFLVERPVDDYRFLAHIKASKTPRAGSLITVEGGALVKVLNKEEDVYLCETNILLDTLLKTAGHIPLPPYIMRPDEDVDKERYQTVYAMHKGSVAAPTAGLHFDEKTLLSLKEKGIHTAYTTLHVGAGTFRPLRCESIADHKMHAERFVISSDLCDAVKKTKANGHRVIAVGTTAMRSLETAGITGQLEPGERETDIFIYPGHTFKICDGLITNFHLPESTLLILVAAFIGYEAAMALYQEAIDQRYRFFSYGDASLFV